MTAGNKRSESERRISPEMVELLPKLLWFGFALVVFLISVGPLLNSLKSGNISEIGIAAVQIKFAQKDFKTAAGQIANSPPVQLESYAEQIKSVGEKLIGAKGLWVSDDNRDPKRYFLERRAFASLGISFDTAQNNAEMLALLDESERTHLPYDFVITDIARTNGERGAECFPTVPNSPREAGCRTVELIKGYSIPVIVYSRDAFKGTPPGALGAAGTFDNLVPLVLDAVEKRTLPTSANS